MQLKSRLLAPVMALALVGCGTNFPPNNSGENGNDNGGGINWGGGNDNGGLGNGGNSGPSVSELKSEVYEAFGIERGEAVENTLENVVSMGFGCSFVLSKNHKTGLSRDMVEVVCDEFCGEISQNGFWYGEDEQLCRNLAQENYGVCQRGDLCSQLEETGSVCRTNHVGDKEAASYFSSEHYEVLSSFLDHFDVSLDEDFLCDDESVFTAGTLCSAYLVEINSVFGGIDVVRTCDEFCKFQKYNGDWSDDGINSCKSGVRAAYDACDGGDCSHLYP